MSTISHELSLIICYLLLPVYHLLSTICCQVVFPLVAVIYYLLLPSIQYMLSIILLIGQPLMYYPVPPSMGLPAQARERTKLYRRTAHPRRTHRAHGTHSHFSSLWPHSQRRGEGQSGGKTRDSDPLSHTRLGLEDGSCTNSLKIHRIRIALECLVSKSRGPRAGILQAPGRHLPKLNKPL